jgi:uncharacterized protein YjbI with pentapeptide repeats
VAPAPTFGAGAALAPRGRAPALIPCRPLVGAREAGLENQVLLRLQRYQELGLGEKSVETMTTAEKGLVLELRGYVQRDDPFAGVPLTPPESDMPPAEKAAVLLRHVHAGNALYSQEAKLDAHPGERWIIDHPFDFSNVALDVLGLMRADLRRANFRSADAGGANLIECDLRDADLSGARIEGAHLVEADLRGTSLRDCEGFPAGVRDALIDVRTFARSGWTADDIHRWQRAGALVVGPDRFPISVAASLVPGGQQVGAGDVFISYASCDIDTASLVAEHLESRGTKVWFAEWDLDLGDDIVLEIQDAISRCDVFVLIASEASLARPWVKQEVSAAVNVALADPNRLVIPVVIGSCVLPPLLASRKWISLEVPYYPILEDLSRRVRRQPRKRSRW